MIEWGIYGLGESTAGMFLAFYYSAVGPYFGNEDGKGWVASDVKPKDFT